MPRISACIISFNEEAMIEECLESLAGVVDEIVVVDSHSTDRTREIAGRYTDRVVEQDWLGMGAQKAFCYSLAENDWVLNLDCDERLDPVLAEAIQAVREGGEPPYAAYEFKRKNYYVYRWLKHTWYPERRTRLFDRHRCEVRGTDPHEYVFVKEGGTGRLDGDLLHFSLDSLSAHLQMIDRYSEVAADEIEKRGRRVTVLTPILRGGWSFVRLYVVKRGFLDGFAGLTIGLLSGLYSFTKYAKVLTRRWRAEAS